MRSQAQGSGSLQGRKARPGDAETLKKSTGFFPYGKVLSRGEPQRGQWGPSLPGSLGEEGRPGAQATEGTEVSGPEKPVGQEGLWGTGLRPAAFGSRGPGRAIPGAQATEPRARGDTAQGPVLPPGQVDSEELLPLVAPKLCTSAHPPREHPGPCRLGAAVVTAGADSRAGDLANASGGVPSGAWDGMGPPGNRGLTG